MKGSIAFAHGQHCKFGVLCQGSGIHLETVRSEKPLVGAKEGEELALCFRNLDVKTGEREN